MSVLDKLSKLREKEVYVPADRLKINVAYPVERLNKGFSEYKPGEPAITATLRLTSTTTGKHYLSQRYVKGSKDALTDKDIQEIHDLMKTGTKFFVVKYGTIAGSNDVDFISASDDNPLPDKITIYNGKHFLNVYVAPT